MVHFIGDGLNRTSILNAHHEFSVKICDSLLSAPQKSNKEIHTKHSLRYGKDALCQRIVDT
jgi:hypothetical protein